MKRRIFHFGFAATFRSVVLMAYSTGLLRVAPVLLRIICEIVKIYFENSLRKRFAFFGLWCFLNSVKKANFSFRRQNAR